MVTVATGRPLSDREYMILDQYLAMDEDNPGMSLEELDGFFCALIAGPELVPPHEYLTEVFHGPLPEFTDMEEANHAIGLLMGHWNGIASTLTKGEIYIPYLLEVDGTALANDWARGFMAGTSMRHDAWTKLIQDEEACGAILPMMALCYEHDPDPKMRPEKPIAPERRNDMIAMMALGLSAIYDYFKEDRQAAANPIKYASSQRGPKVGRNEPCPCGSGKKYKRCCSA